jgi:hypothetical protein
VYNVTALADVLASDDLIGIVARDTSVRVANISVCGCLLESAHRFERGTTGLLEVVVGDEVFADAARVARVQAVFGATAAWHIGLEFLWTSHPGSRSLRRMVSGMGRNIAQQILKAEFVAGRVM